MVHIDLINMQKVVNICSYFLWLACKVCCNFYWICFRSVTHDGGWGDVGHTCVTDGAAAFTNWSGKIFWCTPCFTTQSAYCTSFCWVRKISGLLRARIRSDKILVAVVFTGSALACGRAAREVSGSNRAADKSLCFHENHCDTQLLARAAHLLLCSA